jgi:MYXO-CTERM domain-containing protein
MDSDTADRSVDEGPFRWEYIVGGVVLLALGLLLVLRRA